jgi:hypothetical protein
MGNAWYLVDCDMGSHLTRHIVEVLAVASGCGSSETSAGFWGFKD